MLSTPTLPLNRKLQKWSLIMSIRSRMGAFHHQVKSQIKQGFTKVIVTRAGHLRVWSRGDRELYNTINMMNSLSPFYFLIRVDVICFFMYVNVLNVSITSSQRSKLPCMLLEFVDQMYITGRREGLETLFSRHQWLLVMNPVVQCLLLVKELQT